jgi:manganese transport protein
MHPQAMPLSLQQVPEYNHIAIALDFSENDHRLILHAIGQGNKKTTYILIHIVESAATRIIGKEADDLETRKDQEHLDEYVRQLQEQGIQAVGLLGFNDRAKEIARLVKENEGDMLVIGAHGHSGIKDLIYGQTVDAVRHELKIPVLVVNS